MTLGGLWQGVRQDWNLFEIALLAAAAWAWKKGWRPAFPPIPVVRRPWLWALGLTGGVIALRLALIPLLPVPTPLVTDEFSHLLLADTLLHGRLANPTHPFWQHFESLHIIQQPHYVSNYFPGHAIFLALGRLAFGSAWAGVLTECAGFLLALYWALRGWMPPRWAIFGVLLAALRFAIASYWINAYHGGFLPALGGALVAGAFPRLKARASPREFLGPAVLLGSGCAILVGTRPFEGMFFVLPFIAMLAWQYRRRVAILAKIGLPVVLQVGLVLLGLGVYFASVTGSPFVTAYQISRKAYGWPMTLEWRQPPAIQEPNIEFTRYYEYETGQRETVDGPVNLLEYLTFRMQEYWRFFLGPLLTVPLIMLGRVWRRRRELIFGVSGGIAAILLVGGGTPHYLAPATVMIIAIVVECCRYLSAARLRIPPLLLAAMALVLALRIGAQESGLPYTQKLNYQSWCCRVQGDLNKARITAELEKLPGQHLVFVSTKSDPNNLFQWIYNDAEIDRSRIVWARDLGPERNAQLIAYFAGRHVWQVNPNVQPAERVAYEQTDRVTAGNAGLK